LKDVEDAKKRGRSPRERNAELMNENMPSPDEFIEILRKADNKSSEQG
jgi:hypothetical protein